MRWQTADVTWIVCSVFRRELEWLRQTQQIACANVVYLDSMLHIYPETLQTRLDAAIAAARQEGRAVALVYGECHAYLPDIVAAQPDVRRIRGLNCIEIILGREAYRRLRQAGVFFFLPEWAFRWQEIFRDHLGLNEKNARAVMADMHTRLAYLDTGVIPVPTQALAAIADYTDLPLDILPTSLTIFKTALTAILDG